MSTAPAECLRRMRCGDRRRDKHHGKREAGKGVVYDLLRLVDLATFLRSCLGSTGGITRPSTRLSSPAGLRRVGCRLPRCRPRRAGHRACRNRACGRLRRMRPDCRPGRSFRHKACILFGDEVAIAVVVPHRLIHALFEPPDQVARLGVVTGKLPGPYRTAYDEQVGPFVVVARGRGLPQRTAVFCRESANLRMRCREDSLRRQKSRGIHPSIGFSQVNISGRKEDSLRRT